MKHLFFILLVFKVITCQAQNKTVDYIKVPTQELPKLAAGDILKIDNILNENKANELHLFYNGGNEVPSKKGAPGAPVSRTFSIPANATALELRYDANTTHNYTITLGKSTSVDTVNPGANPKVISDEIPDEDYLNRAIWAAIQLDTYIYQFKDSPDKIKSTEVQKILSRYIEAKRLKNVYADDYNNWKAINPFVKNIDYKKLYPAPDISSLNADIGSMLGGMDVTNYVQAFADFLRDRIKQELTIAYLEKFKKAIEDNKEIRELLPKTWAAFKDNDIFNLPSMGATYKDAFAADLASLPENFIAYEKRYHFADMPASNKEVFIIGSTMYAFINQMAKGDHPSTALHTIALQNPYVTAAPMTSTYVINVTDMLSQNLLGKEGDKWIELETVAKLNPDVIRIFFALLYDKYPDLFDAQQLSRKLADLSGDEDIQQRFNDIYNFVVLAQNVDKRIKDFQDMKNANSTVSEKKEAALDFFLNNSDVLTDLVKTTFSIVNQDDVNNKAYAMILSGLTDAIDIAKAVRSNNLPRATNATISLITTVVGQSENVKWIKPLKNILAFANDMVSAKSSDEIKAVIDNYAAPVQSYKVIRKSNFSVALSAYPGLYVGTEFNKQSDTKLFKNTAYGVTAPIGLAFGLGNNNKDTSSLTAYFSIVDIGAALSYRSGNTSTDIPDKITLAQIFSPGGHLIYGFKNSPLAIKAGYQYAPELRNITTESVMINSAAVWRLSLGICVDIPIYILTSKH